MAKILGLDIDKNSVRAVLVHSAMRKNEIVRCVELSLQDKMEDGLGHAIGELKEELGSPDTVITCLEGQQVSLRSLDLPRAAARHLQQIIPNELESLLPFDLGDVLFDYQPISSNAEGLRVLTASAPKSAVASHIERLESATIHAQEIAAGAAALDGLSAVVPALRASGPIMLIGLDPDATDICFLRDGACDAARTLSTGVAGLPASADVLGREIAQTLAAYRTSGAEPPSAVYLLGDGSLAEGAVRWMSDLLKLDVDVLELPDLPGALPEHKPKFARALALASRTVSRGKRINLRSGDFATTPTLGVFREKAKLFAWCGAAIFAAFLVSTVGRYQMLGKQHEALELRLARVSKEVFGKETTSAEEARGLLEGKGQDDPIPKTSAYDILEAVSRAVPESIVHDTKELRIEIGMAEDRGRLEIEGVLSNNTERAQIATNLRAHTCIDELKEGGTSPAPDGRLRYEIEAVLACPGQGAPSKKSRAKKEDDGLE
ncbi:MAG: hypothetical protein H6715_05135 [Myxococcales bacterium]|nr:hypothetical protein [Myxococcales bacterium]MCB9709265.1 hypothetical protein [Myxococcales bacterium]